MFMWEGGGSLDEKTLGERKRWAASLHVEERTSVIVDGRDDHNIY